MRVTRSVTGFWEWGVLWGAGLARSPGNEHLRTAFPAGSRSPGKASLRRTTPCDSGQEGGSGQGPVSEGRCDGRLGGRHETDNHTCAVALGFARKTPFLHPDVCCSVFSAAEARKGLGVPVGSGRKNEPGPTQAAGYCSAPKGGGWTAVKRWGSLEGTSRTRLGAELPRRPGIMPIRVEFPRDACPQIIGGKLVTLPVYSVVCLVCCPVRI